MRHDQVVVEARLPGGRGLAVAVDGDAVLLGARDLQVLAISSQLCPIDRPVRGSTTPGSTGLRSRGRSFSQGASRWPEAAAAVAREQQFAKRAENTTGGSLTVSTPQAMPDSIWPSAILLAIEDRRLEAGAAGALDIEPRRLRVEARRQDALAHQVEILRVLEHRAADDVAEALAPQADSARLAPRSAAVSSSWLPCRRRRRMGARERNAGAADDGDAPGG